MVYLTWKMEMELGAVGAGWTDVTNDVSLMDGPIELTDGMQSTSMIDLLASPGDIQFVLDNSPANSAQLPGYYTPGHPNCRSGFAKNKRLRFSLNPASNIVASPTAPVPTLETEKLTNEGLETFTAGLADGWNKNGSPTVAQETTIKHGGSSSQKMTGTTAFYGVYQYKNASLTVGKWVQVSGWSYVVSGAIRLWANINGDSFSKSISSTLTWERVVHTGRFVSGSTGPFAYQSTTAAAEHYLDDASVKEMTLASLLGNAVTGSIDGTISVSVALDPALSLGAVQGGICISLDSSTSPANFVLFRIDGNNAHVDQCLGGTWSNLYSVAASGRNQTLSVIKSGTSYQFYIGGVLKTTLTVSEGAIVNNNIFALFSTWAGNTFTNLTTPSAYYQGIYWLKKPIPTAGLFGEAVTRCRATDWLELMMNVPLPAIGVQTSKRGDELITTLLAAVTTQPALTALDTGDSTFASAFDTDDVVKDSVFAILSKIARSEYGRIYMQPDTKTGGVLVFEHRNERLGNMTSLGTISNVMDDAIVIDDAGQVYDRFKVQITPRRVDTSLVSLATLNYHINLGPGESRTFSIQYVEQVSGTRISGTNIQTPVVSTDYKFGSVDDGTTEDLNANLTVTMVRTGANSSDVTVTNAGAVGGYVNLFKLRGYGIYAYNPYTVEVGTGGLRVQTLNMDYQDNPNTADAVANYLQSIGSDNARRACRVLFHANNTADLMLAALTGLISTRWTIEETQTALAGDYFINSRKLTITLGNRLDVEWLMVPAGSSGAWVLGTSALDSTTVLTV